MGLEETLIDIVRETGPYALFVLFGAAAVEYVFPPFPGDAITLLGAFYAVHGVLPLPLVFLAVTAGSVAGAALDYQIGRKLGAAAERPHKGWLARALPRERLHRIEAAYRKHGDLLILVNRFLPGVRGLFFLAAGSSGMPLRRVLLLGATSAALWNACLLAAGYAVGDNVERLLHWFRTYSTIAWIALGAAGIGWLVLTLWRRRRGDSPPGPET